ncbi:TPA: hypothetical protein QDZ34_002965 [Stenotrophomonas maltophilia]|uniref:hypothetical protein n=1 Tax=Stenotrophomonas sp. TaxID=69392 RepID=UPI0028AD9195|nr:hypothetical protein [Stenotrophomonas sp.]HDS0950496.1 hypothetical protein [Stenotrophomonas maltophilia]HDS1027043.1 hypothetical protein [Stenotrophomonas maltophilia]HDS1031028.1 hypothetical protein [Stenotrophomonas maltophilia]HDS1035592.1 hypothetical protein [Stenotrophomonas maltophilia]HDS1040254.1 hypothetical protein [Stenotrophomonas maltophilia]
MNRPLPSDDALRGLHAQSLQALSPATLARLRQARHGAQAAHRGRWRWWLASACSLVVALGIGVQFSGLGTHSGPVPAPTVAATEDNSALYDENPDLYLWLGDTDLAME